MARNLEKKVRAHRIAVPTRFKETTTDQQGHKKEGYTVYPVYTVPSEAMRLQ